MKKAISAQNTKMYLENPDAPTSAYGSIRNASRSDPCVVVLDSVANLSDGEPLLISGTNWNSLNNQSFVAQNIDRQTNSVTLAGADTNDETAAFVADYATYSVSGFIDVCAVSYQINQNTAEKVETTSLCDDKKTFRAGYADPGTLTFDFFIDPTDPDYQALLDARDDGRVRMFMLVYRNGAIRTLPVIVDTVNESGGVDQAVQGSASLSISGDAVLTMPPGVTTPNYVLLCYVSPTVALQPVEVTLVINESGGSAEQFSINWGDGSNVTTTTNNVADHTYSVPGRFSPVVTAMIAGAWGAPWTSQNSVTVEPKDAYSATVVINPAEGFAPLEVTLTVTETNGPAQTFAVDWGDGSDIETLTFVTGTHTYASAGTFQVTVTPTIYGLVQATIRPAPVTADDPVDSITGTVTTDDAEANGDDQNALTFTALNSTGEPVATPLTISVNTLNATVDPVKGTTDADTGELKVTVINGTAETVTVTATGQGFRQVTGSADVVFVEPTPATITGTDATADTPADGSAQVELTFMVYDSVGGVLAGVELAFSADSETAVLSADTATTDVIGRAAVSVADSEAEDVTVTASTTINSTTGTASATFVALAYATALTAEVQADGAVANGRTANTVLFTATDENGDPMPGAYVIFTANSATVDMTPPQGLTGADGTLVLSMTEVVQGSVTVTGTSGDATADATVEFASVGTVANVVGTSDEDSVAANGTSPALVVFTATDENGTALLGVAFDITADSDTAVIDGDLTTDSYGKVTVTVTDTAIETVTLTATAQDVTGTATAKFVDPATVLTTLTVNGTPDGPVRADGVAFGRALFTALDGNGDPMEGQALSMQTLGSATLATNAVVTTDANGQALADAMDTVEETATITATSDNAVSASINFVFKVPADPQVLTTIAGTNAADTPADGASLATVQFFALDADGIAIQGVALTLTASSATALFDGTDATAAGTTDANGIFAVTLTDTVAEAVTVTATNADATVAGTATVNFV